MFGNAQRPCRMARVARAVMSWTVILFLLIAAAQAGQVTLAWNASSGPVAGYRVYYGVASGSYTNNANAGNTTTYTVANLTDGRTYYFAVKAYGTAGNESGFSNEVSATLAAVAPAPVANFNATPTAGAAPLAVQFTNSSTNATSWYWNFGDGTSSTGQNPAKTYASAGTYTVSLTATGSSGSHTATKTGYISVTAPLPAAAPAANFTASPTSGPEPLLVTLTDTSTGNIASRSWNFGDGGATTASNAQTFVRNYAYRSTPYTVSLTVTGPGGSHTRTRTITATAVQPKADFSASPASGVAPLTTTFTDTSTGTVTGYAWNFGDGATSTARNPTKTYPQPGTYSVTLTATGPSGTTSSTKTQTITVSAASASTGGLVAAYNFEEAGGNAVVDASGNGNHGAISGATRIGGGKFGGALSFDGIDDWVTIPHAASLDLTNGMTLQAWVYPTTVTGNRTVLVKENPPGNSVYYLYANDSDYNTNQPLGGGVFASQYRFAQGGATLVANAWSHVAITYDGAIQRLYVNGTQVASRAQTGNMGVSGGVLRIGGNSLWGEFFRGHLDEIRVYNRALTATELKTDMNTAVATSSPPQRLLGEQVLGSVSDALPQRTAAAFQTTAAATGQITSLPVYVDAGSAATSLIAGLYADSNGRPGARLATGTLSAPKAGSWNTVRLPATQVTAGARYWVAILSPSGQLKFRSRAGSIAQPSETSKSTRLTSLPSTWATGTVSAGGPLSGYGAGYGR